MKTKKIFAAALSAFVMMSSFSFHSHFDSIITFSLSAQAADIISSGSCGEGVTFTLDSEGNLIIKGNGSISFAAFTDEYIQTINSDGQRAYVNDSIFKNAKLIKTITLSDGVTGIGDYAFYNCTNVTSLTMAKGIKSVGEAAFGSCQGLTSVTLPDGLINIGNSSFALCTSLNSVAFPKSVSNIGANAFSDTKWLSSKKKENPLVIVNDILIDGSSCSGEVEIPENVTDIGAAAFYHCNDITSVIIPNSVTNIGNNAINEKKI